MSQQLNLLNPAFRRQKKHFSAATMVQALAIVVVACVAMYGYARQQAERMEQLAAETESQLKERRDRLLKLGAELSSEGRSKLLEEQRASLEAQVARREELQASMLKAGGGAGGFTPYLTALARRTMSGIWLTGVTIGGKANAVVIKGRGLEGDLVPAYISSLSREAPFAGRAVTELRVATKAAPAVAAPAPQAAPAAPAQPGIAPAPPAAATEPSRYVEFSVTMPGADAAKAADAESKGAS